MRSALLTLGLIPLLLAPLRAEEVETEDPWTRGFVQARTSIEVGDLETARDLFLELAETYRGTEGEDRAHAGAATTFLEQNRFSDAVEYLDGALESGGPDLENSRMLYSAIERRVRRAVNRARYAEETIEREYEDISWFNVFRWPDKFRLKKDLKEAKNDLEEMRDLHHRFRPEFLLPSERASQEVETDGLIGDDGLLTLPVLDPNAAETSTSEGSSDDPTETVSTDREATEDGATEAAAEDASVPEEESAEASEGEVTAEAGDEAVEADATESEATEDSEGEEPTAAEEGEAEGAEIDPRMQAIALLQEELRALAALVPQDRLDEANAILDSIGVAPATEESPEPEAEAEEESETVVVDADASEAEAAEPEATVIDAESLPESPETGILEDPEAETQGEEAAASVEAEVAVDEPPPQAPATAVDARTAYLASYREMQEALVSNDPERVKAAREAYLQAVQGMRTATTGGVLSRTEAPAAPATESRVEAVEDTSPSAPAPQTSGVKTSTSEAQEDAPAAATTQVEQPAPAPASNEALGSENMGSGSGQVTTNRMGSTTTQSNPGLRISRGAFRR